MLSDDEISAIFSVRRGAVTESHLLGCARAIESAATAPLLARIAELTRELEEARKDAMNAAALICDALPAPPSCNVLERNLWDVATMAAADAIRAAIKEQT